MKAERTHRPNWDKQKSIHLYVVEYGEDYHKQGVIEVELSPTHTMQAMIEAKLQVKSRRIAAYRLIYLGVVRMSNWDWDDARHLEDVSVGTNELVLKGSGRDN